jgi:hypothetical protein
MVKVLPLREYNMKIVSPTCHTALALPVSVTLTTASWMCFSVVSKLVIVPVSVSVAVAEASAVKMVNVVSVNVRVAVPRGRGPFHVPTNSGGELGVEHPARERTVRALTNTIRKSLRKSGFLLIFSS